MGFNSHQLRLTQASAILEGMCQRRDVPKGVCARGGVPGVCARGGCVPEGGCAREGVCQRGVCQGGVPEGGSGPVGGWYPSMH